MTENKAILLDDFPLIQSQQRELQWHSHNNLL